MIHLFNEDCFDTMKRFSNGQIDIVLTSPFYNTNKKAGDKRTLETTKPKDGQYAYVRYDTHIDNMTDEEYCEFTVKLFNEFDRILVKNGVVLYNLNYGSENTEGVFKTVNAIITQTPFTIGDVIVWKKSTALPNNMSYNKLTRIWEFVFVFCRKDEFGTFNCNKRVVSTRKTGQKNYENIHNFVEAKNNDETCPYNKATYSSELCKKLLNIYAVNEHSIVYDPFMGTGTTGIACQDLEFDFYGSEISKNQVDWAYYRLLDNVNVFNAGEGIFKEKTEEEQNEN